MRILPEPAAFLWDQGNLNKNFNKHGVTIQEVEEMFVAEPFTLTDDHKHSTTDEQRFQALGQTKTGRRLFVAFTIRGKKIRVISVRDMSKKEEMSYEKIAQNP